MGAGASERPNGLLVASAQVADAALALPFACIHSLDSVDLLQKIDAAAADAALGIAR